MSRLRGLVRELEAEEGGTFSSSFGIGRVLEVGMRRGERGWVA